MFEANLKAMSNKSVSATILLKKLNSTSSDASCSSDYYQKNDRSKKNHRPKHRGSKHRRSKHRGHSKHRSRSHHRHRYYSSSESSTDSSLSDSSAHSSKQRTGEIRRRSHHVISKQNNKYVRPSQSDDEIAPLKPGKRLKRFLSGKIIYVRMLCEQ